MKLKLRFLLGGAMIFVLGLVLTAVRGLGPGYELLMGVGVVLLVAGLVIILRNPFPDIRSGGADNRIRRRIVPALTAEYVHTEVSFLEIVGIALERQFDNFPEKLRIPLAVREKRAHRHSFHLFTDGGNLWAAELAGIRSGLRMSRNGRFGRHRRLH